MERRKEAWLTWTGHIDADQRCQFCGGRDAELGWLDDGGLFVWSIWAHRDCAHAYFAQRGVKAHAKGQIEPQH
jgi:hypothetical protein